VGMTDLHWAAWEGRKDDIEKLLAKGAEVDCRDGNGSTPLHHAAVHGHTEIVALLIAKGADVNVKDFANEATPLHDAAGFGNVEVVKLLIEAGADINARTKRGWTPLNCATNLDRTTSRFNPIRLIMGKRQKACAEVLREHGARLGRNR